jgi:hypothetical protein
MPEITIAGKKVTVRERFPAKRFHALWKAISSNAGMGELPYEEQVAPYVGTVVAWEFPGDPEKPESWAELDTFTETLPLIRAINQHIKGLLVTVEDATKNSDGTPTST